MKTNIVLYSIIAVYFFIISGVYTFWCIITYDGEVEWAGTLAMLGGSVLSALFVTWLVLTKKNQGGVLLEDQEHSDIDDADPEIGEFSPWSWWPLVLGFGIAIVTLGLCIGKNFWLSFYGLPVVLVSVMGLIYEYYRGNFAR
ncbi:cytochrome c oxidase subunit 4 [Canibacter sp. lx-72]|uniref:aa3-type cytochrome oxidase subunit IV n=1 Tax=Canibacter zhuwentaonis TaxID=2837491 RepID=UPI001BDBEF41|nr:cytochrome c oxidase subunit 4 [Canibacter zhuwentaonis]MBT1017852.1 cytochrome c oxidase subunit 4 [Canibacter zhuwentaonis]MBT1035015.1 cytochrome c oxidase subunit 4 [Canibacter zhuwentaonis]